MVGDILQPTHLLFVLVVALLVLGPKRLPEVGRTLGSGIRDFRQAISGESANPLHDWTHEVSQSSQPELRHEVPDEADAEATAVSEPVSGDAPFPGDDLNPAATQAATSGAPTAPVVERPAVVPGTVVEAQPARPGTPIAAPGAGRSTPSPARPATASRAANRPAAPNGPVRSGIPARAGSPAAASRPAAAPRPAPAGPRPSGAGSPPAGTTPRAARAARPIPPGTRPAPPARPARPRPPARPATAPARPASPGSDDSDA